MIDADFWQPAQTLARDYARDWPDIRDPDLAAFYMRDAIPLFERATGQTNTPSARLEAAQQLRRVAAIAATAFDASRQRSRSKPKPPGKPTTRRNPRAKP